MINETLAYADTPDNSSDQQKLYRIGMAQRMLLWAVLSQLFMALNLFVFQVPYIDLITLAFSLWAIYKLATAMENRLAWLLTLGTLVPVVGFFILLATNGVATKYLQKAGLSVGLMGVKKETLQHLAAVR